MSKVVNTNIKVPTKYFGVIDRNIQPKFIEGVAQNITHQVSVLGEENMVPWLPVPGETSKHFYLLHLGIGITKENSRVKYWRKQYLGFLYSSLQKRYSYISSSNVYPSFTASKYLYPFPNTGQLTYKNPSCAAALPMKSKILEARNMSRDPCLHT